MNDNQEIPNPALREHVTDHSFVLALRKTHIAMLVEVAHNRRSGRIRDTISPAHGLARRGLMLHCTHVFGRSGPHETQKTFEHEKGHDGMTWNEYYRLTRAGWACFDLLVEAGLAAPVQTKRRKVAA
jgi:hypothetical protein